MNFFYTILIFLVLFLMDIGEIKKAPLKEKIIYATLLMGGFAFAILFVANFVNGSIITLITEIVASLRGFGPPPPIR